MMAVVAEPVVVLETIDAEIDSVSQAMVILVVVSMRVGRRNDLKHETAIALGEYLVVWSVIIVRIAW
jgi:hypothetical protein